MKARTFAFWRIFLLLGCFTLATTAFAGSRLLFYVYDRGDPATRLDDAARPVQLQWNDNPLQNPPRFYYRESQAGHIFLPSLFVEDPRLVPTKFEILRAFNAAILTWNSAKFSNFKFAEGVISSQYAPDNPYIPGLQRPSRVALDGYNLITFIDDSVFPGVEDVAVTSLSFFNQDFSMGRFGQLGLPFRVIDSVHFGLGGGEPIEIDVIDLNNDGLLDVFLPVTDFKAGDFIDVDIIGNPANTDFLRTWPENRSDLKDVLQFTDDEIGTYVYGSIDVQALLTSRLGQAAGLGMTSINDAVMNPFINPGSFAYPSDPYDQRILSFDDEMQLGIIHGDFPSDLASIGGVVLEGDFLDGTPPADDSALDLYVSQVPLYLLVSPAQVADTPELNNGRRVIPSGYSSDDVISAPIIPNEDQGVYRRVAVQLSGQSLSIPLVIGEEAPFFPFVDPNAPELEDQPGGTPSFEDLPEDAEFAQATPPIDSSYRFPGIPSRDQSGLLIKYGVQLGDQPADLIFNVVHAILGALESYESEFYGGNTQTLPLGSGDAVDENILQDAFFENNFIVAEVDPSGKFSAAINDGPPILSGFNGGPQSYVVLGTPQGTFSNKFGLIGPVQEALQINDLVNTSFGSWARGGNFQLRTTIDITANGGIAGIPSGILVSHVVTNRAATQSTFQLRQVIDTYLFGRENPVYNVNGQIVHREVTLSGGQIPAELRYQSTEFNPAFSGYITMRAPGFTPPTRMTIAQLHNIADNIPIGTGEDIRGSDALVQDTAVALNWDNIVLGPNESAIFQFIVGFFQPLPLEDGFAGLEVDAEGNLTGGTDDPEALTAVTVEPGQHVDNIDILTNTGTPPPAVTDNPEENRDAIAGNPLQFIRAGAFPDTDYIATSGELADIDGDGDLDVITANSGGGEDPINGRINRLYLNEQRTEADGSISYFFRDVTYGNDNIPGTVDDRLKKWGVDSVGKPVPMAAPTENTAGVLAADFNLDGHLDLFFTNLDAPDRLYINEGGSGGIPGYFVDQSDFWLPGLLNRGLNGENAFSDPHFAASGRATAGDIDSDGDPDLIISMRNPTPDSELFGQLTIVDENGEVVDVVTVNMGTSGWIDASPRTTDQYPLGDRRFDMTADLFSGVLRFSERVLINQVLQPNYAYNPQGFYFKEETLGSDDRFGTLTSLMIQREDFPWSRQLVDSWLPTEVDRMAPLLPFFFSSPLTGPITRHASPMGNSAWEPHLGPFFGSSALDLVSFRPRTLVEDIFVTIPRTAAYTPPTDAPPPNLLEGLPNPPTANPAQVVSGFRTIGESTRIGERLHDHAFFRNVDIFSVDPDLNREDSTAYDNLAPDGIADGYFACINYNADYGTQVGGFFGPSVGTRSTGPGFFPIAIDLNSGRPNFVYDNWPLFIGLPQGNPADHQPDSGFEGDIIPQTNRNAWTGVIDDFENRGAAKVFVATDGDVPEGGFYVHSYEDPSGEITGNGVLRGEGGMFAGVSNSFFDPYADPYTGVTYTGTVETWPLHELPDPLAPDGTTPLRPETLGSVSGDFDRDGDQDLFLATSTDSGIYDDNATIGVFLGGNPARSLVYLNDSFARFTENSGIVLPNSGSVSMDAKAGDVDNDGDIDIVLFNALAANELLLNTTFRDSPNPEDTRDGKMFYEATQTVIPPLSTIGTLPLETDIFGFSGVTLRSLASDFNNDGRQDLVLVEGGSFKNDGDFVKLFMNTGEPAHGGVHVFQPIGSNIDGRVEVGGPFGINGSVGTLAWNTDAAIGDVDRDGDQDLLIVRQERSGMNELPQLLINEDSDNQLINSIPDADSLGDGLLINAPDGAIPDLMTAGAAVGGYNLKRQARRVELADFDGDGDLDAIIANARGDGGAPNVLMLNQHDAIIPVRFTDNSETGLPLQTGGTVGIFDVTRELAVGDFDHDGDVDILFANEWTSTYPTPFRLLLNEGNAVFLDSDPSQTAADSERRVPKYENTIARGIAVADFDGLGEPSEDKNHNGFLDVGEDTNGNGFLDWTDLPTESEDLNGNGTLDAGEDGLINLNGTIDTLDRNNDGVITIYRDGVWEGSLDIYISFGPRQVGSSTGELNRLLINDPTNRRAGWFADETSLRFDNLISDPSGGVDVGDIDLDGDPDIVVSQIIGGVVRPVRVWRNNTRTTDGNIKHGFFKDISYEVTVPMGQQTFFEFENNIRGADPLAVSGWAFHALLLDIDGDGDLDLHVASIGNIHSVASIGGRNMAYYNRVVGDSWNSRGANRPLTSFSPHILGLTPPGGGRGEVHVVDLYGYNFDPGIGIAFGSGVAVTNVEWIDQTHLRVTLNIAPNAQIGPRRVTAQNPSGGSSSTKMGMFTVYDESVVPPIRSGVGNRYWMLVE